MDNQNNDPSSQVGQETVTETVTEQSGVESPSLVAETTQQPTAVSFLDGLDVSYKNDPDINKFKSTDELAKGYKNLSKTLGKDKAVIPSADDKEGLKSYLSKIGLPETSEGYNLETKAHEGVEFNELDGFKNLAHSENLTQSQAQGLMDWYTTNKIAEFNNSNEKMLEGQASSAKALREEYGQAYDEKISRAQGFFKDNFAGTFSDPEVMKVIGSNPSFIKDLVNLNNKFSEGSFGGVQKANTLTPAEAKAERQTLMQSDAYMNSRNPAHKATVEKARGMITLMQG